MDVARKLGRDGKVLLPSDFDLIGAFNYSVLAGWAGEQLNKVRDGKYKGYDWESANGELLVQDRFRVHNGSDYSDGHTDIIWKPDDLVLWTMMYQGHYSKDGVEIIRSILKNQARHTYDFCGGRGRPIIHLGNGQYYKHVWEGNFSSFYGKEMLIEKDMTTIIGSHHCSGSRLLYPEYDNNR